MDFPVHQPVRLHLTERLTQNLLAESWQPPTPDAFPDAGLRITVWNRTPGRDRELIERGAVGASSAEEAVAASALTVVCGELRGS
ncbi:hypothetical protein GCM10009574_019340 [Streptomyces asiaticus]|uniref:Uncharacterized protein n=1 Tax=Streptomyces rhizosphaericus TaxID=114699 RepID=A0ABN1RXQ8_9ACTN